MKDGFIKFPSTPHLAVLGKADIRDDKVMSEIERDAFLDHDLIVEEKIDGANLGISFAGDGGLRLQNRGAYLTKPFAGQWQRLQEWITTRQDGLFDLLSDRYVMFGEWCVAVHSVFYDRLPGWFLGFDVFDRVGDCFVSSRVRDGMFSRSSISAVPRLAGGRFAFHELGDLLRKSRVGSQAAEGLYLRYDIGDRTAGRAKLVRQEFMQSMEAHWSRGPLRLNKLRLAYEIGRLGPLGRVAEHGGSD